ncbi:MAG: c-type cytochrome, partial [Bacteroidota bacterium]
MILRHHLAVWGLLVAVIFACDREQASLPTRPHSPWAFRSVLDSVPRVLTVALHDDLWLAYNTENGNLNKAWKGSVNFDGAVYTTVHGPQPSSLGDFWLENPYNEPWLVFFGEQKEQPTIQYRGHEFREGQIYIKYNLQLRDGQVIQVEEHPEYTTNEYGQAGLERTFMLSNVPEGAEVVFLTHYASLPTSSSLTTTGVFQNKEEVSARKKNTQMTTVDAVIKLNNSQPTVIKALFNAAPTIPNPNKVVGAEAEERRPLGYRLIARSDCRSCHNAIVQTIGPSYNDIASRYRNTEENIAMLVNKVMQGGAGNWGEAAMTPHPDLPPAQARAMVSYIMRLDAEQEAALAEVATEEGVDLNSARPAAEVEMADFLPG